MNNMYMNYYKLTVKIFTILYLNILWVLFTLLGLVFFGIFPSTIAMFKITREWIIKKNDVAIFKTFWRTYKENFIKGNKYALIFYLTAQTLLMFMNILETNTSAPYVVANIIVAGMLFLLILSLLYFLPIYVHFELDFFRYFQWALVVSMSHPVLSVILILSISALVFVMYMASPLLVLILFPALSSWIVVKLTSKVFFLYERR